MATLTASTHLVIPSLIGRGLTENAARKALNKALVFGTAPAEVPGKGVLSVKYVGGGKFTVQV